MKWFNKIMILTLVALWLPATLHCKLEELPGLQFLACCDHEQAAPHQDNDCRTDSCAMLEDGLYKVSNPKVVVPLPLLAMIPDFSTAPASGRRLASVQVCILADRAPELPVTWQFSARAALPPRAPALAS